MLIEITYNVTDVYMSTTETPIYVEISFEQPGGTSAVWGSITGTLSNQTDLQNALNAKLDELTIDGGTEGQILSKASATDFDFAWINNYAKYLATNVRNQTGSTIGAFQVVYISGATGNKPLISLADADTEATSSKTYGVTATAIANNGIGDVVTAGELTGIDTSAFNEGDLLWLSTTAGGVVTSPPAEPAHAVFIGYVVRSHPTLGVIDVAIANGYELNELHGVQITTPTDNQGLFYNSTSTLWENKSITTALGYTPVPTTRNITINGVTYDLSADRTYTISTGISGSGASGQVTYWTGASAVSGSNNLFWDNANGRLGIGTNAPAQPLHISGSGAGGAGRTWMRVQNTNTGSGAGAQFINGNNRIASFQYTGSTYATGEAFSIFTESDYPIVFSTNGAVTSGGTSYIAFSAGGFLNEAMRITGTKNLLINTTTDAGQRLQVIGDTLLRGSGATSATTALRIQNSGSTSLLLMRNDGVLELGGVDAGPFMYPITTSNAVGISGTNFGFYSLTTTQATDVGTYSFNGANLAQTSGNVRNVHIYRNFQPTSGTATYSGLSIFDTINQTGGANGITRGLYVNPTLTAAADWRSIEWSNNSGWGLYGSGTANNYLGGNVAIGSTSNTSDWLNIAASTTAKAHIYLAAGVAPTSPANGDIWFDGTDIKMRIGGVTKTFTLI